MLLVTILPTFTGCNSGSSSEPGPGLGSGPTPELKPGHYFIQSDADDLYHYDQYFVVQAGNRFEFVEYGNAPGQIANLCQVTRQKGSYATDSTTLTLTYKAGGDGLETCHMTKAQFDAYPFEEVPSSQWHIESHAIRKLTGTGFDGENLFFGISGWKTYPLRTDPYGFY
ncbi:MAG: hypothetical protein ABIW76_21095 [Fibrobacteria bacterium]